MSVGLQRGWLTKDDVARAAVEWLSQNPDENLQPVLRLAASEHDDPQDVQKWLGQSNEATDRETEEEATDRWRWAFLADLYDDERMDGEAKMQRLEELISEFGYPADMDACSRYYFLQPGATDISPLAALRELVPRLESRIFG